jgi:16S rRNA (cytidine1402-2'-O)-methyltransferase
MPLYIVATPIGHLADISRRAIDILQQADFIAAEDTRHSKQLCQSLGIEKQGQQWIAFHQHNEQHQSDNLLKFLKEGKSIALISDAGTPAIADPGARIVEKVLLLNQKNEAVHNEKQEPIKITPIPGCSAVITALSVAGLSTTDFYFAGFLPTKSSQRQQLMNQWKEWKTTIVCYETPHRILECFNDWEQSWGNPDIFIARELTKQFEQIGWKTTREWHDYFIEHAEKKKGEWVIIIRPTDTTLNHQNGEKSIPEKALTLLASMLNSGISVKQSSDLVSQHYQLKRGDVYDVALQLKSR